VRVIFPWVTAGTARARACAANAMVDPMLDPAILAPERVRGLHRDEYEALIGLGVFDDQRIELLRGAIVEMSAQEEPHARIAAWFHEKLILALNMKRYEVRGHTSFAATEDSVPEPDVAVYPRELRERLPRQALLVIEVADSSLRKDRVIKTEIYAESGVPEYWIVNVRGRTVEVRTRPRDGTYTRVELREAGDTLRPIKLRGFSLPVARIPWREPAHRSRKR
jgi:Uma2 family endonuclease